MLYSAPLPSRLIRKYLTAQLPVNTTVRKNSVQYRYKNFVPKCLPLASET